LILVEKVFLIAMNPVSVVILFLRNNNNIPV